MNWKHCYVQAGFIKRQWNQRENCQHLLDHRESIGIPEKHLLHFIDYVKAFDCVDHNKLWKILKEVGIPDYFTCLLRNLYPGQEATVRTRRGTTNWFQIRKGIRQGYILSPCFLNLYAKYIMQNSMLDESLTGIKIARRNIKNLKYADNTTLMAESKEELESLLMKVKEQWKSWLKTQHAKNEDHSIWFYHLMVNGRGKIGSHDRVYFLGLQNYGDCNHEIKRWLLLGRKAMTYTAY